MQTTPVLNLNLSKPVTPARRRTAATVAAGTTETEPTKQEKRNNLLRDLQEPLSIIQGQLNIGEARDVVISIEQNIARIKASNNGADEFSADKHLEPGQKDFLIRTIQQHDASFNEEQLNFMNWKAIKTKLAESIPNGKGINTEPSSSKRSLFKYSNSF